jgi:hypothetical protein
LGTRTTDFSLGVMPIPVGLSKRPTTQDAEQVSVAGAAMVVRCGAARADLASLVIRMKSPQGAVEVIVAHGKQPAPSLDALLPERASGPTSPTGRPGPPPAVGPLAVRRSAAERDVVEWGGTVASQVTVRADNQGKGQANMRLDPGCHRLVLMPDTLVEGRPIPIDLDVEVREPGSEEAIANDRSFATDAMTELCVGAPRAVEVLFGGANHGGEVVLLHGNWSLPGGIPEDWAPAARAWLAHSLLHRKSPKLTARPIWQGMGVTGTTTVSAPVDPDGCYLIGAAAESGDTRAIQVAAQAGGNHGEDNGGGGIEAAVVSICAGGARSVRVEVDAIGSRIVWMAGIWKVARVELGTGETP